MVTSENTPELRAGGESTFIRIAQRSSNQPEWQERPEGGSHDTDFARVRSTATLTGR